jgi:pantoate--beta-alanine ligase
MPRVITSGQEIQHTAQQLRAAGRRIGLVPTMGALHEGHLSLVRTAKAECDVAIATIFVNPTQFGPQEDLAKYPRTLEADLKLLDSAQCDLVFAPSAEEVYPPDFSTYVDPPAVAKPLEGAFRPGHFRGVCTVVLKLFHLVPSDVAYFGRKDYQQALVIQQMVRDLKLPLRIEVCPIVRESDGLALSSRNRYLSTSERQQALALSQALRAAKNSFDQGEQDAAALAKCLQKSLRANGIERIDYATIVDAETLSNIKIIERPAVALIACHVGTTRLIDNQKLVPSSFVIRH